MEPPSRMENYLDYVSHRPGVQMDGEARPVVCRGHGISPQAVREVAEHTAACGRRWWLSVGRTRSGWATTT